MKESLYNVFSPLRGSPIANSLYRGVGQPYYFLIIYKFIIFLLLILLRMDEEINSTVVIRVCRMRGCGMLSLCFVLSVVPRFS